MNRDRSLAVGVGVALGATLGAALPTTAPVVAAAQATPTLELTSQTTWVRDDDNFEVTVEVQNAPPGAGLDLTVHDKLEARRDLVETIDTSAVGGTQGRMPRLSLDEIPTDLSGQYPLSYPVGDTGADLDSTGDYGVYPVVVQLSDTGGATLAEPVVTYLLLLPDATEEVDPLSVGVTMELGTPEPGIRPDGITNLSPDEWTALRTRVDLLAGTDQLPLTVAPVPETLDALGLGGGDEGQTLLEDLRQALQGREVLARPYVDLDVDALAAANLLGQVGPERGIGVRTLTRWLHVEPVPDVWLTDATIDTSAAETLRGLGIPRAIVPSSAVESVPDHPEVRTPTKPVNLVEDGPLAIVADEALGQRLLGQDGVLDGQRFLAELMLIWAQSEDEIRGIAVRVPDSEPLDQRAVLHALGGLASTGTDGPPVLQATTASDLLGRTPLDGDGDEPAVVELAPAETPSDDLTALQPALAQASAVVEGLAGTLTDGPLIGQLQRSLLIAPGYTTPDDERMSYVRRVDDERNSLASAINAPAGFTLTLTARDGNIPLSVGNTSDQTVTVKVHLNSSQLEFPDGATFELELPPNGVTENVPVSSRTSGAFPLRVTITSPDDRVIFDRRTFTIRSTAISGVGLVLSIGAALFLLIWWARHWRTTRRARKLVPEHAVGRRRSVR